MATSTLRTPNTRESSADLGRLVLRVVIGLLILFHGVSKLMNGVGFISGMLEKSGLPPALAYAVYIGEVLAPILLIVGVWTRAAAIVIVINMLTAIYLVHLPDIASMTKQGGYALELQAMYLFGAVAVALLGAGRMSIGGRFGPMN